MASFIDRLQHSWNVFRGRENIDHTSLGPSFYSRPDVRKFTRGNRQSITAAAYNRIALDCAAMKVLHCRVDQDEKYVDTIDDDLNKVFNIEANLDQSGRAFMQDIIMSMMDEGVVAVVPTDTNTNITSEGSFTIQTMRTAKIEQWYPNHVKVNIYDPSLGRHVYRTLPKRSIAIIENPLAAVMNEPNSTLQRLIKKMNMLDYVDEQIGNGKLDMIIQLPFSLRTAGKKAEAALRKKEIEEQLHDSKYGIAYIDATEKITQLNRPVENNLVKQVQDLRDEFYNQLGLTKSVFDGTASEAEMLNYYTRTIEPLMAAVVDEFKRKFLTKTARSQGQSIKFFREPFKLTPVEKLADIADKFTRNAILSSNELRGIVGYKPVNDPRADELSNKNINEQVDAPPPPSTNEELPDEGQAEGQSPAPGFQIPGQMTLGEMRQIMRQQNNPS